MSGSESLLESLPTEVFAAVLDTLSTRELLPLLQVNHHFYCAAANLYRRRLVQTASLPDNELILESYHPTAKISTPCLSCRYKGVKTPDGIVIDEHVPRIPDLQRMYSSFRPVMTQENRWRRFTFRRPNTGDMYLADEQVDETAVQDVYLDDGERFSQLCVSSTVAKEGPKRGLYLSHTSIGDGVVRVFREWLTQMASESGWSDESERFTMDSPCILWVDMAKTLGLRFRVAAAPSERMPLISGPDDDPPVSYNLIYEELLVQTSKLLLAVESSLVQEVANTGKAIVISAM